MHFLTSNIAIAAPPTNFFNQWTFPVGPLCTLAIAVFVYLRGWRLARRPRPLELMPWRAACFVAGVVTLWIAIASPIDALDDYLLSAHMIQHFLLMSVAPPLIVLGQPQVPMLRGLPRPLIRALSRPLFRTRIFHHLRNTLTNPVFAWLVMNIAYLGWHVPALFELTFRSESIHQVEHICFFLTSLAFWWVVIAPWPAKPRWQLWAMIPYLLTADVLNTVLSAILTFSGRVLYPSYAAAERITHLTPLQDQAAAGAEMWVLNSLVFLIPAVLITLKLLGPRTLLHEPKTAES
jgi:putative membrane protein